jgi:hypothetical protein
MRFGVSLLALCFALAGAHAQEAVVDECPTKTEYACFDVINSSLCLSSNAARGSKETLAKCVDFEGGMSDLPGATKVSERLCTEFEMAADCDVSRSALSVSWMSFCYR